jgi:hypothetical protein
LDLNLSLYWWASTSEMPYAYAQLIVRSITASNAPHPTPYWDAYGVSPSVTYAIVGIYLWVNVDLGRIRPHFISTVGIRKPVPISTLNTSPLCPPLYEWTWMNHSIHGFSVVVVFYNNLRSNSPGTDGVAWSVKCVPNDKVDGGVEIEEDLRRWGEKLNTWVPRNFKGQKRCLQLLKRGCPPAKKWIYRYEL